MALVSSVANADGFPYLSMSLAWRPTSDINDPPSVFNPDRWNHDYTKDLPPTDAFDGVKLQLLPFVDKRKEKDVGANVEEHFPRAVATTDDVAAFVTAHFGDVLQSAHVNVVDSDSNCTLKGEVRTFFVQEDNTYKGSVFLGLTLSDSHGREIWQGTANGRSKRFGHSLSAENYSETLSDALVDAVADLLKSPSFQKAARSQAK
jgi:hypothetical protein